MTLTILPSTVIKHFCCCCFCCCFCCCCCCYWWWWWLWWWWSSWLWCWRWWWWWWWCCCNDYHVRLADVVNVVVVVVVIELRLSQIFTYIKHIFCCGKNIHTVRDRVLWTYCSDVTELKILFLSKIVRRPYN